MLTNKITEFSADLLNTVRGILSEAKKCSEGCECEKCEAEQMKEGSMPTADEPSAADKKTAEKVRAMMAKEKKLKEDIMEMVNEASDGLADKAKKSGVSLSTLKKVYARGIAAWNSGHRPGTTPQQWAHARVNSYITKGKGTYHGADKDLRSEGTDMPFEGPYKKVGDRKDEYGNKVKNVAKYLAKKAMNKQKNEEVEIEEASKPGYFRVSIPHKATQYHNADHAMHARELAQKSYEDAPAEVLARRRANGHKKLDFSKASVRRLRDKVNLKSKYSKEEVEQMDEISAKTAVNAYAKRNAKAFNDGQYDDEAEKDYNKLDKQGDRIKRKFGDKTVRKAQGAAYKKIFGEEADQIDELSKKTLGSYIGTASADKSFAAHDVGAINQIAQSTGTTASDREEREQLNKRHAKRSSGIGRAVDKLTKEEQDFVDSLNNEIFEKADPYDIAGMIKKAKAKNDPNHPAMKHVAAIEDIKKHGGALSVQGDHVRSLIKALGEEVHIEEGEEKGGGYDGMPKGLQDRSPRGSSRGAMGRAIARKERNLTRARMDRAARKMEEEVELDEARGRPKKGVAKDFTIHPKTKEKLMHNNPEHMKKIEVLQKNGILEKPKAEADEHVMNQLRKAKTSMLGGSKINFTHGDSKEVSGTHAAKILTKYAGMKPNEKEAFQKFVGHSHENLMKHV